MEVNTDRQVPTWSLAHPLCNVGYEGSHDLCSADNFVGAKKVWYSLARIEPAYSVVAQCFLNQHNCMQPVAHCAVSAQLLNCETSVQQLTVENVEAYGVRPALLHV